MTSCEATITAKEFKSMAIHLTAIDEQVFVLIDGQRYNITGITHHILDDKGFYDLTAVIR